MYPHLSFWKLLRRDTQFDVVNSTHQWVSFGQVRQTLSTHCRVSVSDNSLIHYILNVCALLSYVIDHTKSTLNRTKTATEDREAPLLRLIDSMSLLTSVVSRRRVASSMAESISLLSRYRGGISKYDPLLHMLVSGARQNFVKDGEKCSRLSVSCEGNKNEKL